MWSDAPVKRAAHSKGNAERGFAATNLSGTWSECSSDPSRRKRERQVSVSEPIALLYGRGQLKLRMPAQAEVTLIAKGKLHKIADPAGAVRDALSEPIDSQALAELARGRKSACILICDITRPVPNHLFLRPMIETLVASGIALNRIVILVATGLHRKRWRRAC